MTLQVELTEANNYICKLLFLSLESESSKVSETWEKKRLPLLCILHIFTGRAANKITQNSLKDLFIAGVMLGHLMKFVY